MGRRTQITSSLTNGHSRALRADNPNISGDGRCLMERKRMRLAWMTRGAFRSYFFGRLLFLAFVGALRIACEGYFDFNVLADERLYSVGYELGRALLGSFQ